MKRVSVALAALAIAIPPAAQAQDYGYCYSLGRDGAGQREVLYTGVFPWAAGSTGRAEGRAQMKGAFRASLSRASLHAGSSAQLCRGREEEASAIQSMQDSKRRHEDEGVYKITSFSFTPPQPLAAPTGNGSPGRAETASWVEQYVRNNLSKARLFHVLFAGGQAHIEYVGVTWTNLGGCRAKVSYAKDWYTRGRFGQRELKEITVDMSRIEKIGLVRIGNHSHVYGFNFLLPAGSNDGLHLPVAGTGPGEDLFAQLKEGQLYKALNNLRRQCGAPEPLSFN